MSAIKVGSDSSGAAGSASPAPPAPPSKHPLLAKEMVNYVSGLCGGLFSATVAYPLDVARCGFLLPLPVVFAFSLPLPCRPFPDSALIFLQEQFKYYFFSFIIGRSCSDPPEGRLQLTFSLLPNSSPFPLLFSLIF